MYVKGCLSNPAIWQSVLSSGHNCAISNYCPTANEKSLNTGKRSYWLEVNKEDFINCLLHQTVIILIGALTQLERISLVKHSCWLWLLRRRPEQPWAVCVSLIYFVVRADESKLITSGLLVAQSLLFLLHRHSAYFDI